MPWFIRRAGSRKTNLVLERLWSLWTEFGCIHLVTRICICNIVRHEDCHDWSYVEFYFRLWTEESIWVWSLRHWVRVRRDEFLWWCLIIIYLLFWKSDVFYFEDFDHGCDLEPEIFSSSVDNGIEHPYNVVRWNAMSKGGVKVDHPMDEL